MLGLVKPHEHIYDVKTGRGLVLLVNPSEKCTESLWREAEAHKRSEYCEMDSSVNLLLLTTVTTQNFHDASNMRCNLSFSYLQCVDHFDLVFLPQSLNTVVEQRIDVVLDPLNLLPVYTLQLGLQVF